MSDERTIGEHSARLDALEDGIREIRADVKQVLAQMAAAQGGWKTLLMLGGFSAAVGSLITKLWPLK